MPDETEVVTSEATVSSDAPTPVVETKDPSVPDEYFKDFV